MTKKKKKFNIQVQFIHISYNIIRLISFTICIHFRQKTLRNQEKGDYFDPFLERNLEHPTT